MEAITTYYNKIYEDYRDNSDRILQRADSSAIHEIRVNIKEIRAVFKLLGFINSSFDFDVNFNRIHSLFHAAGLIRDIDITLEIVKNIDTKKAINGNIDVSDFLRRERKRDVRNLKKIAARTLRDETASQSEIIILLFHINKKNIMKFLERLICEIPNEISKNIPAKQLHNIRKLCKEYFYIAQATEHQDIFMNKTDEVQKLIGKWHDYHIANHCIEVFCKGRFKNDLLKMLESEEKKFKEAAIREVNAVFV